MLPLLVSLCLAAMASDVSGLDNGLALTPPMGWMSWQRFGCNIDCKNDPKNCISEQLYKDMADHMAADGYKEAGYEYVNIDDCWASKERDPKTFRLVPDPERFPSGMKALADYIHGKGLKIGTYGDMGFVTCGGYPGSKFTMELDAQTFADWGIDSFKMDGCASRTQDFDIAYPIMEMWLNKTGRPIMFSCSWPAYMTEHKEHIDYPKIAKFCNIWRNYADISDSWGAVQGIINFYGTDDQNFSDVSGPGNFNDPDMIIAGSRGLSPSQEQVQMAMWAMFAAPLFLSADLRDVNNQSRALMLHKGIIAINQDPLGKMGKRVFWPQGGGKPEGDTQVWVKPILPTGSYAIAVFNKASNHDGSTVQFKLADLGINPQGKKLLMTEIFEGKAAGVYDASSTFSVYVDVSSVYFAKLVPSS